jgi:HK97 gp10 family phage protein
MSLVTFRVEGFKELDQAFNDLANTVGTSRATGKNVAKRALTQAAAPLERAVAAAAPVASGHLQTSITTGTRLSRRQSALSPKEVPVEVYVGAGPLPQAHMQEFGTHDQPAQPFFRPAWDAMVQAIRDSIASFLWLELQKAAARAAKKAARLAGK